MRIRVYPDMEQVRGGTIGWMRSLLVPRIKSRWEEKPWPGRAGYPVTSCVRAGAHSFLIATNSETSFAFLRFVISAFRILESKLRLRGTARRRGRSGYGSKVASQKLKWGVHCRDTNSSTVRRVFRQQFIYKGRI